MVRLAIEYREALEGAEGRAWVNGGFFLEALSSRAAIQEIENQIGLY